MAVLGRSGSLAPLTSADIPDNSVSLTKMAGGTDGQIITYDASGDPVAVGPGTDGQVITSTGAGSPPAFEAAAGFASGTKMIFNQTAAPTGWTKVTGSGNDTALRVTTGTVGTGGSVAFETAFASVTPTITANNAATTLAITHLPNVLAVTSTAHDPGRISTGYFDYNFDVLIGAGNNNTNPSGATGHTHANSPASSAINLDVSYVDVIIATKD